MNELKPKEVLQAIIDGKTLECKNRFRVDSKWRIFNPKDAVISIGSIFAERFIFRPAQEMITVGDVSFPKPESEPRKAGEEYWVADPTHTNYTFTYDWYTDEFYEQTLTRGFLHRSRENAIAHAKALIKLSGGTVDE